MYEREGAAGVRNRRVNYPGKAVSSIVTVAYMAETAKFLNSAELAAEAPDPAARTTLASARAINAFSIHLADICTSEVECLEPDADLGDAIELMESRAIRRIPIVENGQQTMEGLNYEMTAWRHGEEAMAPFHDEVGYLLWDKANGQVMRCFAVPRGLAILCGPS